MNSSVIDFITFRVIVDYGHNVPVIKAMGSVLSHLTNGRKIVVAHGTGNRLDEHIRAFGAALADVYDHMIVTDADPRHRRPGETSELVRDGSLANGFAENNVEIINNPTAALARAFAIVGAGDTIVVQVDDVETMLQRVMEHFERIVGTAELSQKF